MTTRQMWATFVLVWLTLSHEGILDIEPRATIWVTWANASGIKDFCLSLQQADDPFRTCLIGIPLQENETDFEGYWKQQRVDLIGRPDDDSCFILNWPSMRNAAWQKIVIENLNQLTSLPLQELDLLASVTPVKYVDVTEMPNCHNVVPQLQPVNGTGVVWFGDP